MIDGKLSLVLPAHNEEENLRPVVERALEVLPQQCRDWEIVVVDDGSRDATPALAAALAEANPGRVRVVTHPRNRGYGAALTSGFAAASGDYLMFMDSDRQFDIADLARLAPFVGVYDIVAGYRIKRNDPWHRFAIGYTFNAIVTILFGINLRDIDCGFKVFRAGLLRGMALESPGGRRASAPSAAHRGDDGEQGDQHDADHQERDERGGRSSGSSRRTARCTCTHRRSEPTATTMLAPMAVTEIAVHAQPISDSGTSSRTAMPPASKASAVRIHARNVRSLASVKR